MRILLLGQVQDADSVKLDEAKGCLRKALLRSHALIEQLEDVHHANDEDSGITDVSRGQVDGDEVLRALCEIARTHQSRLELLGFDGAVLLPELISGDDCMERETILLGLVRELFADVAKHADARYGYVLTVEASLNEYLIRLRDVAAADASIESGGTGLSRYEAQLKRQGGYLRTQCEDVESGLHWWSLEARVLACNQEGNAKDQVPSGLPEGAMVNISSNKDYYETTNKGVRKYVVGNGTHEEADGNYSITEK